MVAVAELLPRIVLAEVERSLGPRQSFLVDKPVPLGLLRMDPGDQKQMLPDEQHWQLEAAAVAVVADTLPAGRKRHSQPRIEPPATGWGPNSRPPERSKDS